MSLAALPLLLALAVPQQPADVMEARTFKGASGGALLYRLYAAKSNGKPLPLLLFLHGAGERGSDNAKQLKHGVKDFLKNQKKNPCHIVAPQCPTGVQWVDVPWGDPRHTMPAKPTEPMQLTMELIEKLVGELGADPARLYVTGLSMGGFGTWDIISRKPDLFAAAVPVCGGGDEAQAPRIAKVPQWIFHGGNDKVVLTARSRNMAEALKKAGGTPRYTEYPGVGHFCWNRAYRNPEFYSWLFSRRSANKAR